MRQSAATELALGLWAKRLRCFGGSRTAAGAPCAASTHPSAFARSFQAIQAPQRRIRDERLPVSWGGWNPAIPNRPGGKALAILSAAHTAPIARPATPCASGLRCDKVRVRV